MPQFDVSTYIPQMFWVLVIFFCYWLLMDKFLIPKIAEMVEARKRKYDNFILKAEEINKKAQESLEQYENTLSAARADAKAQIAENEAELKEFIAQKEAELKKELSAKIAEHAERLSTEKEIILKQIDELSAKVAYTAVQQLNLPSITQSDIDKFKKEGEY